MMINDSAMVHLTNHYVMMFFFTTLATSIAHYLEVFYLMLYKNLHRKIYPNRVAEVVGGNFIGCTI